MPRDRAADAAAQAARADAAPCAACGQQPEVTATTQPPPGDAVGPDWVVVTGTHTCTPERP